jgi:hypothetical protein
MVLNTELTRMLGIKVGGLSECWNAENSWHCSLPDLPPSWLSLTVQHPIVQGGMQWVGCK